jgi:hypothetical protein
MKHSAYKCPECDSYCDLSDYSEGLVCPAHGLKLEKVTDWTRAGRFALVGDIWLAEGIPTGRRDCDNDEMSSLSMGCPNPNQQKEFLALHAKAGIDGTSYNQKTGALRYSGGRKTQKQLMAVHAMHDNN